MDSKKEIQSHSDYVDIIDDYVSFYIRENSLLVKHRTITEEKENYDPDVNKTTEEEC